MARHHAYPPIADYGLIGDCQSAALVSREGSIDWYCLPRFDSGSAFGRLLDFERGGHCAVAPTGAGPWEYDRGYLDDGNFPQGLTHLAHIDAAVTLADVEGSP